jgi:hypothetical protein
VAWPTVPAKPSRLGFDLHQAQCYGNSRPRTDGGAKCEASLWSAYKANTSHSSRQPSNLITSSTQFLSGGKNTVKINIKRALRWPQCFVFQKMLTNTANTTRGDFSSHHGKRHCVLEGANHYCSTAQLRQQTQFAAKCEECLQTQETYQLHTHTHCNERLGDQLSGNTSGSHSSGIWFEPHTARME